VLIVIVPFIVNFSYLFIFICFFILDKRKIRFKLDI